MNEAELIGALGGFLAAADRDFNVQIGITANGREVDILVSKGEHASPVEIKRSGESYFLDAAGEQVKLILHELHQSTGFVFVPPPTRYEAVDVMWVDFITERVSVGIVAPSRYLNAHAKPRAG
jgi:hypothetical protein